MVKIHIEKSFTYDGQTFEPGETVDLPKNAAESVQEKGYGSQVFKEEQQDSGTLQLPEEDGLNVENMLPGGNFISHEDVEEGDTITIRGTGEVDDSFDSERLVLPVTLSGEERQVSLGPENIERISEEFGMNTSNWIGEQIKVALIKKYKGLGQKGIVWKPVKGE